MKAITISTLGDLRRQGIDIYGNCSHQYCGKGRLLNLDVLIDWLGEDYSYVNETRIGRAFKCGAKGHKGGFIHISGGKKSSK